MRGHLFEGRERAEEVLALPAGEPEYRSRALEGAGGIAYWQGDFDRARELYEEALEIDRALGDRARIANALYNLSFGEVFGGDREKGTRFLEESLELYEQLEDESGIGRVQWNLGNMAVARREYETAKDYFTSSVEVFERIGGPFDLGWALFELARTEVGLEDFDEARTHLQKGVRLFHDAGDMSGIVMFLNMFSTLERLLGNHRKALCLQGAADNFRRQTGADLVISDDSASYFDWREIAFEELEGADKVAFEEGGQFSVDEAVGYALSESDG